MTKVLQRIIKAYPRPWIAQGDGDYVTILDGNDFEVISVEWDNVVADDGRGRGGNFDILSAMVDAVNAAT